jgi:hypothetical protein
LPVVVAASSNNELTSLPAAWRIWVAVKGLYLSRGAEKAAFQLIIDIALLFWAVCYSCRNRASEDNLLAGFAGVFLK